MSDQLTPTAEEARLLRILDPSWWAKNAPRYDIHHTEIGDVRLTHSGVVAKLVVAKKTNLDVLRKKVPHLRTLLDVQDEHPLDVMPGGRASLLGLAVRTRRVTDYRDMRWSPGTTSIGVDTVTGQEVHVPLRSQIMVSGVKRSGKSWSLRPLIMAAKEDPGLEPIFIDPKRVEGAIVRHQIPALTQPEKILSFIDSEHDEMMRRARFMEKNELSVWDERHGPTKIIIIDEGRDFLSLLRSEDERIEREIKKNPEDEVYDFIPYRRKIVRISSMGGAYGYYIWWATQYPITGGDNPGVDSNVKANSDYYFSLRVSNQNHARVSLDADAWYGPHLIPADPSTRGLGYLAGHGPTRIQTWTVTDEMLLQGSKTSPSVHRVVDLLQRHGELTAVGAADVMKAELPAVWTILSNLVISGKVTCRYRSEVGHVYWLT